MAVAPPMSPDAATGIKASKTGRRRMKKNFFFNSDDVT
jgi:hypothetical protein